MKKMFTRITITLTGLMLTFAGAGLARGDAQLSPTPEPAYKAKTYKGSITSVDAEQNTMTVRGGLTTRTFNTATGCQVVLEDKAQAALPDLRAGQKVEIHYRNVQGVPVVHQVVQKNRVFKGHVTALDPANRSLAVKRGVTTRNFALADGYAVIIKDDKSGSLENLRIGDTVMVIYRSDNDPLMAHRVEQKNPTFTGTVRAMDARTRTVTARNLLAEKKFHLGNGCKIVANGKAGASLRDLRIGDRISISYEDAAGVLVANRVGQEPTGREAAEGQTAAVNRPSAE